MGVYSKQWGMVWDDLHVVVNEVYKATVNHSNMTCADMCSIQQIKGLRYSPPPLNYNTQTQINEEKEKLKRTKKNATTRHNHPLPFKLLFTTVLLLKSVGVYKEPCFCSI